MSNSLEQLRRYTTVVSDSGDFECECDPSHRLPLKMRNAQPVNSRLRFTIVRGCS